MVVQIHPRAESLILEHPSSVRVKVLRLRKRSWGWNWERLSMPLSVI